MMKNVKLAELKAKIATAFLNAQTLEMVYQNKNYQEQELPKNV